MSNEKTGSAASASRALQPTETNPLDFVPDKIPFDTPYSPPISLDRAQAVINAAVAEAKKRSLNGKWAWEWSPVAGPWPGFPNSSVGIAPSRCC